MLLFNDESLTEEKRIWMTLCKLEEGYDKLRKSLFRKIGELEKQNKELKQDLWNVRQSMNEPDMFSDLLVMAT